MADFTTQTRIGGYSYHAPMIRKPETKLRDLYRETEQLVFKTPRVEPHDCREAVMTEHTDKRLWETQLLSLGLNDTFHAVVSLHANVKEESGKKKPDKLLYDVGQKGSAPGDLNYPRGLIVSGDCDIIIADTMNHRIQRFNQSGILKNTYGKKGKDPGEFNQPTGVAVMSNDRLVVADRKNKRIQVLSSEGTPKFLFLTGVEPFAVCCDKQDNIIVSTFDASIITYDKNGYLKTSFSVRGPDDEKSAPKYIAVNDRGEVIISDPTTRNITTFSYRGQQTQHFEPLCDANGLACCPAGICLNPLSQVLVADSLNHTVNLYTENGVLLEQLIGPNDSSGAVQQCVVGPEGHLVVTEYSANGVHCIKVFRYRECECHRTRPGSSKRFATPASTQT